MNSEFQIANPAPANEVMGARLKARAALQRAVDKYNDAACANLLLPCQPDILQIIIKLAREKGLPDIADELAAAVELERQAA